MNLTWVLMMREDRQWGMRNQDGSFNGMVGSMGKGEADMVAASVSNRPDRHEVVDFSVKKFKLQYSCLWALTYAKQYRLFSSIRNNNLTYWHCIIS